MRDLYGSDQSTLNQPGALLYQSSKFLLEVKHGLLEEVFGIGKAGCKNLFLNKKMTASRSRISASTVLEQIVGTENFFFLKKEAKARHLRSFH